MLDGGGSVGVGNDEETGRCGSGMKGQREKRDVRVDSVTAFGGRCTEAFLEWFRFFEKYFLKYLYVRLRPL